MELFKEGPGVLDHTHLNELNQIGLCMPNHMQEINHGMERGVMSPF